MLLLLRLLPTSLSLSLLSPVQLRHKVSIQETSKVACHAQLLGTLNLDRYPNSNRHGIDLKICFIDLGIKKLTENYISKVGFRNSSKSIVECIKIESKVRMRDNGCSLHDDGKF